jgi:26S proteasome regulatory subunit N9
LADPKIHLTFLTDLLSRIDVKKSQDAHVLLLASIAHAKLLYGDLAGTKTDMDEAWKILDNMTGVEDGVNAAYYGVAADYYKVRGILSPGTPILRRWTGESRVRAILQKLSFVPCVCGSCD